jgi:UDP-N-acetylglucosamine--N-acetylmuramyl-(pentapeptide) pyrophosphoryl-undecaprenol N-acetylglucosamine transferase
VKILVAAGGTGGHFYPGLAVARSLVQAGHGVVFVVRAGDYVLPLLEREKLPYVTLAAAGFKRRLAPSNIAAAFKILIGLGQAFSLMGKLKPDAVLVMGGYLSFAPAVAARSRGIPVVLHEQNAVPGLANRFVSRLVRRIAVSFEESRALFGPKAVLTGNPVRGEFRSLPSRDDARRRWGLDPARRTVLVFGGSLGAQRLNSLILEALPDIAARSAGWQFLHFTGASDEARVKAAYAAQPFLHHVEGYCHEMPAAYAAADLVVCRAGASTLAELIAVRRPALLVPYPLATGGHQTKNARMLTDAGAAVLREQRELTGGTMAKILDGLMEDAAGRKIMEEAYASLGVNPFSAADQIRDLVLSAAG